MLLVWLKVAQQALRVKAAPALAPSAAQAVPAFDLHPASLFVHGQTGHRGTRSWGPGAGSKALLPAC